MYLCTPIRGFRPGKAGMLNPYRHNPTPLSEEEKVFQESKPVWDRVFDHGKYMQHEGPLKVSQHSIFTIIIFQFIAFHWYRFPRCRTIPKNEADETLLYLLARP